MHPNYYSEWYSWLSGNIRWTERFDGVDHKEMIYFVNESKENSVAYQTNFCKRFDFKESERFAKKLEEDSEKYLSLLLSDGAVVRSKLNKAFEKYHRSLVNVQRDLIRNIERDPDCFDFWL